MDASTSPVRLPLDALQLAAKFFLPLAFFYTAGRVLHDLILVLAVTVGDTESPGKFIGFGVMSLAVLATLAAYVAMFRVLARGQRRPRRAQAGADDRLLSAIAHTLLPFLIFYGAWGLFVEDVRRYSVLGQELFGVERIQSLALSPFQVSISIAVAAFLIRAVVEKFYERTGHGALGLVATVFESMWMFFAVLTVEELISEAFAWVGSRAAWAAVADVVGPVFTSATDVLAMVLPDAKDALVVPLIWLTIAAVVYGGRMQRDDAVLADTRVQARAAGAWERLPGRARLATEFFSRDLRDKYTPMANGLRMVFRGGPIAFLTFCLCYTLLAAGRDWAFIGVTGLAGPHEVPWWTVWHDPIKFGVDAIYEVLRISLIAAAFSLALARGGLSAPAVRSPGPSPAAPRHARS